MGRPKKSVSAPIEPEDEVQVSPDEEPARVIEPAPAASTMSKADACRAALAAGIEDAEKAQEFTRSKFGVEIKATDFALYKSKAKQAASAPKKSPGRKPKVAAPLVDGYVAPPEKPKSAGEPDVLLAMETVKDLVGQFGADKLKRWCLSLGAKYNENPFRC